MLRVFLLSVLIISRFAFLVQGADSFGLANLEMMSRTCRWLVQANHNVHSAEQAGSMFH